MTQARAQLAVPGRIGGAAASNGGVPFFGLEREFAAYGGEFLRTIQQVLQSGALLQGEPVVSFEEELARRTGRQYAVAVNSCTDALYLALRAAGIGPGDEVLVTDFSFVASASCIVRAGAKPVFVDVGDDYNMDLERAAEAVTGRTKAIIFVHLYGAMSDPVRVANLARDQGLVLIEDAAQALGSDFRGIPAGATGLASCFSFDPTKVIGAPGSGGALLTDDPHMAERVRRLRFHGKAGDAFVEPGYNSQMPTLTAAVLNLKLQFNDAWRSRRRAIADAYARHLAGLVALPPAHPQSTHVYHKFVIATEQRDALRDFLLARGIQNMIHYAEPLHRQPCFRAFDYRDDEHERANALSRRVLSLPIHPFLEDEEVRAVVGGVLDFFEQSV